MGLPSVGQILLWSRLFQGATWLGEPGRTAGTVAQQLEYSDGAAFRRALRLAVGATPSEIIHAGGLTFMLSRFREVCAGIPRTERPEVATPVSAAI